MKGTRYRYNLETKQLEEDSPREPEVRTQLMTDGHYADLRATDGTPIDSRTKHRAYMRANNLAIADDFKNTWAKAAQERAQVYQGNFDKERRLETVKRAYERVSQERRRRR